MSEPTNVCTLPPFRASRSSTERETVVRHRRDDFIPSGTRREHVPCVVFPHGGQCLNVPVRLAQGVKECRTSCSTRIPVGTSALSCIHVVFSRPPETVSMLLDKKDD